MQKESYNLNEVDDLISYVSESDILDYTIRGLGDHPPDDKISPLKGLAANLARNGCIIINKHMILDIVKSCMKFSETLHNCNLESLKRKSNYELAANQVIIMINPNHDKSLKKRRDCLHNFSRTRNTATDRKIHAKFLQKELSWTGMVLRTHVKAACLWLYRLCVLRSLVESSNEKNSHLYNHFFEEMKWISNLTDSIHNRCYSAWVYRQRVLDVAIGILSNGHCAEASYLHIYRIIEGDLTLLIDKISIQPSNYSLMSYIMLLLTRFATLKAKGPDRNRSERLKIMVSLIIEKLEENQKFYGDIYESCRMMKLCLEKFAEKFCVNV